MPRFLLASIVSVVVLAHVAPGQFGGSGGQSGGAPGNGQTQLPNTGIGGIPAGSSGIWGPGQQVQYGPSRTAMPSLESSGGDVRGFPLLTGPQGLGNYPVFPGYAEGQQLGKDALIPPVGALRPSGLWPAWLTPGQDKPAQTDSAILVRNSDRVWYRAADEAVFIPLPYFDKIRSMSAGAGIQVRTESGGFNVLLHDGATIRAEGRTTLETRILSEAVAEFEVIDVRAAWVASRTRLVRLWLPDNSAVEAQRANLWLAREADRVVVRNYGPQSVKIRSSLGDRDLARNQEVRILASPVPETRPALSLTTQGTIAVRGEGRKLRVEGGTDGGSVDWLGARVQISAGSTGVLDAMAGSNFPDYRGESSASGAVNKRGGR